MFRKNNVAPFMHSTNNRQGPVVTEVGAMKDVPEGYTYQRAHLLVMKWPPGYYATPLGNIYVYIYMVKSKKWCPNGFFGNTIVQTPATMFLFFFIVSAYFRPIRGTILLHM